MPFLRNLEIKIFDTSDIDALSGDIELFDTNQFLDRIVESFENNEYQS